MYIKTTNRELKPSSVDNRFQYRNGDMCNRRRRQHQPQRQSGVVNCQRVNSKSHPCIQTIQTTAHWFVEKPKRILWMVDNVIQKPGVQTKDLARLNDEINEYRHRSGANANDGRQNDGIENGSVFCNGGQTQTRKSAQNEPGHFIQYFADFFHQQIGEIPSTVHEHAPSDVVK